MHPGLAVAALAASVCPSVASAERAKAVLEVIAVEAPVIALRHVTVIDGTGARARRDQTVIISGPRIQAVGDSARVAVPAGAKVLDLAGTTVLPGLVGMHEHLFMAGPRLLDSRHLVQQTFTFPRLYLASGVTTIRTTGSIEPIADLEVKRLIDDGQVPGPRIHVTGPYLEGPGGRYAQMRPMVGAEEARRTVNFWADAGVTSFKAYMHIGREELRAAIEAAHARGLKVTGHLCTIGFRDAVAAGIDNLEHGFLFNSDFFPNRGGDICPPGADFDRVFARLQVKSPIVQQAFVDLIKRRVAVTSTLAVVESVVRPELDPRVLELLAPGLRELLVQEKAAVEPQLREVLGAALKKNMELERAFVRAGGILLAGSDPTIRGFLAGFGNHRQVELLVTAGFTPVEAIHIATQNGAEFLGEGARLGTVTQGKLADLVVVRGDPAARIADIRNVELVFKDGVGYDPRKLTDPIRGRVGL
jgi:imidazolonepropionase-like amidohydrolase